MVYQLHDIVQLKKDHPCKKSSFWEITRMGVDIKLKCLGCGSSVMLERIEFEKRLKKIIQKAETTQ
ncbi:MAG: DUF951 domain-containing protein [Erysipelotrichaceae bacterium]|nr:DUF951 domain-containing protein [Erysipelotrichaceae bacterium]MCD8574091.1 DUF951 domain-containing protein [Erysipelotrichaceae bacterium]